MSDKDKSKKPPSLGMALFQAFKQIEAGGEARPQGRQGADRGGEGAFAGGPEVVRTEAQGRVGHRLRNPRLILHHRLIPTIPPLFAAGVS